MRRHFVGDWSNDNQPQKPSGGAASPEDVIEDFVTNPATFRAEINTGLLPIQAIGFADVFGCEYLGGIFAPRFGRSREAEPRIFAATGQHVDFRNGRFEEGLITEAAIDGHQQGPIRSAFLVQQLAKVFNQAQGGGGQILILARGTVLLQLGFSSCFARLAHNRYMLKADRKRASRKVALLIMRKRQRCLEQSQSPNEVDMEGGRHRIAVPGCSGNVFASLMDLRVIHRHHDRTLGIPLQILIMMGIKQLFRLPGTPRKKLIVGVPVLLGAAQYTGCFGKWCGRPWLLAKPARARLHAGACGDRRKHPSSPPSTSRHSAGPASRLPTFESEDVLIAAQEPLATSNLFDQRGHDRLPIQTSPMQFLNTVQNLGNMERLAGSAEYVLHHI